MDQRRSFVVELREVVSHETIMMIDQLVISFIYGCFTFLAYHLHYTITTDDHRDGDHNIDDVVGEEEVKVTKDVVVEGW